MDHSVIYTLLLCAMSILMMMTVCHTMRRGSIMMLVFMISMMSMNVLMVMIMMMVWVVMIAFYNVGIIGTASASNTHN